MFACQTVTLQQGFGCDYFRRFEMEFLSELITFKSLTGEVISVVRLDETFMFRVYTGCCMISGCPGGGSFSLLHDRTWKSLYSK
jgi:hypothetical protein